MKSATEDASLGIAQASIVEDRAHLKERIDFIHENTKTDALVEEYIEGRELYVSVCGNERLTTFPVWEMDFGTLPERHGRHRHPQGEVGPEVPEEARHQDRPGAGAHRGGSRAPRARSSKRIYRALHMSGYARMDFRMRAGRHASTCWRRTATRT